MVWSLALCHDGANQDPMAYGAEFSVVFLAKGPRTASIQEGLDCLGLYHSGLEGERYIRLVVELMFMWDFRVEYPGTWLQRLSPADVRAAELARRASTQVQLRNGHTC